jgi:hypothetical protein
MKIDRGKIVSARHSLVGFTWEQLFPVGSIELSVMAGTYPSQKTIMVKFSVIDRLSGYNAIVLRMALNELKAVTLTPHLSINSPPKMELVPKKLIRGWPGNARPQV